PMARRRAEEARMLRSRSALLAEAALRFACSVAIRRAWLAAPAGVVVAREQSVRVLAGRLRLARAPSALAAPAPTAHAQVDPAQPSHAPFAPAARGQSAPARGAPGLPFLARLCHALLPARVAAVQ